MSCDPQLRTLPAAWGEGTGPRRLAKDRRWRAQELKQGWAPRLASEATHEPQVQSRCSGHLWAGCRESNTQGYRPC